MKPWKDWPYWLKGGIVGVIVGIVLLFIPLILSYFVDVPSFIPILSLIWIAITIFLIFIFCGVALEIDLGGGILGTCETRLPFYFSLFLSTIIIGALFFGIGSLIGLIIGKIKYKESFGWKVWPYWLKGGIIGLILGVSYVILRILLAKLRIIIRFYIGPELIFNLLIFVIFCILIGWIFGKYKERKR